MRHISGPDAWAQFWRDVKEIGVWKWKSDYINLNVMDGRNWVLAMEVPGRRMVSAGINAYPGSPVGPEYPCDGEFAKFVAALDRLL